jgi:hypothetical protein
MSNNAVRLGFFGLSLGLAAGTAEAKLIRYEINGQTYSYSTNNIQQTKEARRRIEAAAAASAAKARAQAEATGNPLATVFGSPAQREAANADARLQQVLRSKSSGEVDTTSSIERPEVRMAVPRARARQERPRPVREARLERTAEPQGRRMDAPASGPVRRVSASHPEAPSPSPPLPVQLIAPIERPQTAKAWQPGAPREAAVGWDSGSLSDFVNQVRKAPAEGPRL